MDDSRRGPLSGGFLRPFIPAEASPTDSGEATPPAAGGLSGSSGTGQPGDPPDVITDQVAGLAQYAVELPSITDFVYDEPPQAEPPAARATPANGRVPPLPGFSPPRGAPAARFADEPRLTPATPVRPTPAAPVRPAPATPVRPAPALAQTPPLPRSGETTPPVARPADDWSTGEWQRYDWRSAASLAPDERARAAEAWADLDWEAESRSKARQRNEAIAAALEGIARRVRSGELPVHGHPGMTEEAAAAAALAAILARRP